MKDLLAELRASTKGRERDALVDRLIDAIHLSMPDGDLFYPWRPATALEKLLQSEEAATQRRLAKSALQEVLVNENISFEMQLKVLEHLVDHHPENDQEGPGYQVISLAADKDAAANCDPRELARAA